MCGRNQVAKHEYTSYFKSLRWADKTLYALKFLQSGHIFIGRYKKGRDDKTYFSRVDGEYGTSSMYEISEVWCVNILQNFETLWRKYQKESSNITNLQTWVVLKKILLIQYQSFTPFEGYGMVWYKFDSSKWYLLLYGESIIIYLYPNLRTSNTWIIIVRTLKTIHLQFYCEHQNKPWWVNCEIFKKL